jgi:hypothetical protein
MVAVGSAAEAAELISQAAELVAQPAGEFAEQVIDVDPELGEQSGITLGVYLVRQLLLRLVGLARVARRPEEVEDLLLVDLHDVPAFLIVLL